MPITYPLIFPTHIGRQRISIRAVNQVAVGRSPYTFREQTFRHSGQMWQADVTLPPMKRANAEQWIAWLLSLNGRHGTFLMGDPLGATARGEAGGSPQVVGSGQTGNELYIGGATVSQAGWLLAGDYVQLGSGTGTTLHKVLSDVDTDASGTATIPLWPSLRSSPVNDDQVVVSGAVGRWRLVSNETAWDISEASVYGLTFGAVEAIS